LLIPLAPVSDTCQLAALAQTYERPATYKRAMLTNIIVAADLDKFFPAPPWRQGEQSQRDTGLVDAGS